MKHWDERERAGVEELRLPRADAVRLAGLLRQPPRPKRGHAPQIHSLIGLGLALGLLAGLAFALSPGDPVSSKLLP